MAQIIEYVKMKNYPQIIEIYDTSGKICTNVDEIFKRVAEQLINLDNQCYLAEKV